ncbi:MAG: cupin domain-containing protein [Hyphomicrobiaceae bacterium]
MDDVVDPEAIIAAFGLEPHPEGGHYVETFRDRDSDPATGRPRSTAILFLLRDGEVSHWHRIDAAEVWHWHAGGPLELSIVGHEGRSTLRLGRHFDRGEVPQAVVPPGSWQSARPVGGWVLVGCTVAPGFDFAHFELAPAGWEPPQ